MAFSRPETKWIVLLTFIGLVHGKHLLIRLEVQSERQSGFRALTFNRLNRQDNEYSQESASGPEYDDYSHNLNATENPRRASNGTNDGGSGQEDNEDLGSPFDAYYPTQNESGYFHDKKRKKEFSKLFPEGVTPNVTSNSSSTTLSTAAATTTTTLAPTTLATTSPSTSTLLPFDDRPRPPENPEEFPSRKFEPMVVAGPMGRRPMLMGGGGPIGGHHHPFSWVQNFMSRRKFF